MRLLAYSLLIVLLSFGCGGADASFGGSSGSGGYGGYVGTTGSWTPAGGSGGGLSVSGGATSSTASSGSTGGASATSSASSSSSSTSSGVAGDAGLPNSSGDCTSDAECPSGQCVAVTPGGFNVCLVPPVPATTCASTFDLCCPTSTPCPSGEACYLGPLVPVCSGLPNPPHNQCAVDQCSQDADCVGSQICAQAGTFGLEIRACVAAYCKLDSDCTAHANGTCAPVQDPCCSAFAGLYCVYPGNGGCRSNADCSTTSGLYCDPDPTTGVASCQSGGPVCPA